MIQNISKQFIKFNIIVNILQIITYVHFTRKSGIMQDL